MNDDEIVPAPLQQALRRRGRRVSIIDPGVRGYGTDQSVGKANVLREAGRK